MPHALLLGLAACEPPPDRPQPTVTTISVPETPLVTEPSPWTYPDAPAPAGEVDLPALGEALDVAIDQARTYAASPLIDAYLARYDRSATVACPGPVDDGLGNVYWANGCNAADGTYFGGYLTWSHFEDLYTDDAQALLTGDSLGGNIALVDVDGGTLDLEGSAGRLVGASLDGTLSYVQSSLVGGFALDAGDASGWLLDGMQSVELVTTTIEVAGLDGQAVAVVDGAVVPRLGDDVYSVRFTGATMALAGIGSACATEPGGVVVVRDPAGRWVEVTFHGPVLDVTEGDASRCDGCGDAVLLPDRTPVGELCADFTPWLTAEMPR